MTTNHAESVDPDGRALDLVAQLTLAEKLSLVSGFPGVPSDVDGNPLHNPGGEPPEFPIPPGAIGSDGYIPGIDRLGIPPLHFCGAGAGLTNLFGHRTGGEGTAFPPAMAQTATWDPGASAAFGRALAREAASQGLNVLIAGASNLAVDPRCGRLFEYRGEDPILAAAMVSAELRASQDEGLIAAIKHYAANFQETGRYFMDAVISERALRQGDLLVFELAIASSGAGAVMAAYNKVNGTWCCENHYLLTEVLKQEWGFAGWVMSDWGANHSTARSALAGLDQEFPFPEYFGDRLGEAITAGEVPMARLDDMCRRILRSMIAVGVMDRPFSVGPTDYAASAAVARTIAERSIVLLRNDGVLPLSAAAGLRIAVIGGHADKGVPSGGGSAEVDPVGGDPLRPGEPAWPRPFPGPVWIPSAPLAAITVCNSSGSVTYCDGIDLDEAAAVAAAADVAIVFAVQWTTESLDLEDLTLPDGQDALVAAVAAANPRTVVVLETGGPVFTPWADQVGAILAAWYPGQQGGPAVADVLFGRVNPSGRLPVTFPRRLADLPRRVIDPIPVKAGHQLPDPMPAWGTDFGFVDGAYQVRYHEDVAIGYKWYDSRRIEPAYCFGHGLSYTEFHYADLEIIVEADGVRATWTITNCGPRSGTDICQLYAGLPDWAGEPPRRLVGWTRTDLDQGETAAVHLQVPAKHLAIWDEAEHGWRQPGGDYRFDLGASSRDLRLHQIAALPSRKP